MKKTFDVIKTTVLYIAAILLLVYSCKPKIEFGNYASEDEYTFGVVKEKQRSDRRIGASKYTVESDNYPNLRFHIHTDKNYAVGDTVPLHIVIIAQYDEDV